MPSDRVAWIVPVHRPHFAYARTLLAGVHEHELSVDVHFVLGDRAEADELSALLGPRSECELIAAAEHLPDGRFGAYLANGSVINAKKLLALSLLRERYELLCTLDSEVRVLRPGDVRASQAVRHERRAFAAHRVAAPFMAQIVHAPARLLGPSAERRIVGEVTDGGRLYAWFEDVPAYEAGLLGDMLERLGAGDDITVLLDRLSWFDFDHLLYQYFCCSVHDWSLCDVGLPAPDRVGAWWELWRGDQAADRAAAERLGRDWAPSWVCDAALADVVSSAFLAFHLDRDTSAAEVAADAELAAV